MRIRPILSLIVCFAAVANAAEEVDYSRDIKPLLAHKCTACHSALKQEAGLRLDAGVLIRKGSENGSVVVPGNAASSLLLQKVTTKDVDERMPPDGEGEPLDSKQIALLSEWINGGAKTPKDEIIPADANQHWAYQLPKRQSLAPVKDPRWAHPIDTFIAREHRRLKLTPVELVDRTTLLRRVYLDLIGLPPTPQQLQQFLDDQSSDAWQKVVDSLLGNPNFGVRWGRHWMDVWRYSDWDGYKQQLRGSQRHIWRWRDWIIRSLNQDKGYDRMIVEMLAGDEVAPTDRSVLSATGFLARSYHKSNRNMWLDATVEHTAKAFLGVTLNCARCHDHKFDPLPQTAYYQFRAIFEPHNVRTDQLPEQPEILKDGLPRAFDSDLTVKTFLFERGNDKHPDKDHPMTSAVPAVLGGRFEIQAVTLPLEAFYPALTESAEKQALAAARNQLAAAEKAVAATQPQSTEPGSAKSNPNNTELLELKRTVAQLKYESLESRYTAERAKYATTDADDDADQTKKLAQNAATTERQLNLKQAELAIHQTQAALKKVEAGKLKKQKRKVAIAAAKKKITEAEKQLKTAEANLKKKPDETYTSVGKVYPRTSSGRRLGLANWIATKRNPLTARVAVNHIWMRHFGEPLVDNVFDFGMRSPRPRHADLLDWLAVEFMENNWSLKHLHRLIVTSRTWRLASSEVGSDDMHNRTIDQDNHFLWRMNTRRLEAEIIRDSVLAVAGQLDETIGGPDIDFRQGEVSRRRSIYLRHAYEKQMTMLVLFDAPSPLECYRRSQSIIPQQGLALMNSTLAISNARLLASRLWQDVSEKSKPQQQFVRQSFLRILSRPPSDAEQAACQEFLVKQAATLSDTSKLTSFAGGSDPKVKPASDPQQRAKENLVQVLMNHNDFISVR